MINFKEANNAKFKRNGILFILGVLFFAYSCARAYLLGITYDEAFVYNEFVRNHTFFSPRADGLNVQLLNNYLMIVSTKFFGISEFALRIPNVLAHAIFIFYSAKLTKHLNGNVFIISAFLIINVNPYMLDFFSLARQYGLSMAFMMASIYQLYKFCRYNYKRLDAIKSMCFAALTVFSSVVMLNYFLSLFGVLVLLMVFFSSQKEWNFRTKGIEFFKSAIIPSLVFFSVLLFIVPQAQNLKEANQMFFGQNNGFFQDTLLSATYASEYGQAFPSRFLTLLPAFFVVFVFFGIGVFLIWKFKMKEQTDSRIFFAAIYLIILLCSLSTIVQFYLFSTNFLFWRTTLFLIVLFNWILVFFINELSLKWKNIRFVSYFISILLIVHFLTTYKWRRVLEWKENEEIKTMMFDLQEIKSKSGLHRPAILEASFILQPCINYYRDKDNLTWLNLVNDDHARSSLNDYYLLSIDAYNKLNSDSVVVLKSYRNTNFILARPRYENGNETHLFSQEISFSQLPGGAFHQTSEIEFSKGFEYKFNDSTKSFSPAIITFSAEVLAKNVYDSGLEMVITLERNKALLFWKRGYISDFINVKEANTRVTFSCICGLQTEAGDVLKAYIWNPNHHDLFIQKMSLVWTKRSPKAVL